MRNIITIFFAFGLGLGLAACEGSHYFADDCGCELDL
jgi:hypothetical protein